MLTPELEQAVNRQINDEFQASYLYLSMAAFCEQQDFPGMGNWLRIQSEEEHGHAMKLFDLMNDWDGAVRLEAIAAPATSWESILAVFQEVHEHEQQVTRNINTVYGLALECKAFNVQAQLHWFLIEQVEEEKVARDLVAKLRRAGDNAAAVLAIDAELASRIPEPAADTPA